LADNSDLELRQLEPGDKVTGLSVGDPAFLPLKTFFRKHAKTYEAQSLARTYVVCEPAEHDKPIAFITLVCGEIETQGDTNLLGDGVTYRYHGYPAVKLARLAVDARRRSAGLGRLLVEFALGLVKEVICPAVGCRFMVVDSKRESVAFYESCGFTMLDTGENRARDEPVMFIDLHKIQV